MKRAWLVGIILVFTAALSAHADGPAVPLNVGNSCALISQEGVELVPAGLYAGIETLSETPPYLYVAYSLESGDDSAGYVKLLDEKGQPMTDFLYGDLSVIGDEIYFMQDGLYGVMDRTLKVILSPGYTVIVPSGEGGYLALTTDPYDDRADGVYYVDSTGKETPTGIRVMYGLSGFSEGVMPVFSADTGRFGYLNTQGEWAIPAQFNYAGAFTNGLATASIDSGTGLIDLTGNWLLTPKYEFLSLSNEARVAVAQVDETQITMTDTETFETIQTFTGEDIGFAASADSGMITLYMDGETFVVNGKGETVLSARRNDGMIDADEHCIILRDGPWGEENTSLYDLKGVLLAGPYQDIWRVSAAGDTPYYAFASFDTESESLGGGDTYLNELPDTRKTGLMDADGKELWAMDVYNELYSPVEGIFVVETADRVGVVRADGTWLWSGELPDNDFVF